MFLLVKSAQRLYAGCIEAAGHIFSAFMGVFILHYCSAILKQEGTWLKVIILRSLNIITFFTNMWMQANIDLERMLSFPLMELKNV